MARIQKSKKEFYIESLYFEDEILKNIRTSVPLKLQQIQIGVTEANILSFLIKLSQAKKVLELGTLAGYSTLWIARTLPDDGSVISVEKSKDHFDIAYKNLSSLKELKKISLINDDALNFMKNSSDIFDTVFIDANKTSYPSYLNESYRLLKRGGLLIADNTFLNGQITLETTQHFDAKIIDSIKQFNENLANHKGFSSCIIPTYEGLSVAVKL